MDVNRQILRLTQKYIIDYLNLLCFSNTVSWDGIDQFHELPILDAEQSAAQRQEQRGGFLIHKKYPWALKILVTVIDGSRQEVCYRIQSIKDIIKIDDPKKTCYPLDMNLLDFSIADSNLGLQDPSSYSFYTKSHNVLTSSFALLDYLLNSHFIAHDSPDHFKDLLIEVESYPPLSGDKHYVPVFEAVSND